MSYVTIDFETRSACDIRKAGAERYAEDASTRVLCLAWAFDDEPPEIWFPGAPDPVRLFEHIAAGGEVVAHNAAFELVIWRDVFIHHLMHAPPLRAEQCNDTMARARAVGLPGDLEGACAAMRLPVQKDMEGRRVMLRLSKPLPKRGADKNGPPTYDDDPEKLARLYDYCKTDVLAERLLHKTLPPLSAGERDMWLLDYKINQRGIALDVPAIRAAADLAASEVEKLSRTISALTKGAVNKTTQNKELTTWLNAQGVETPGVAKAQLADMLTQEQTATVRAVLETRQEASKVSTSKLKAMLAGVCQDGRARGLLAYHGAQTGRWAGRRIQPQNMPRTPDSFSFEDACEAIEIVRSRHRGAAAALRLSYGTPLDAISWSLRSLILAYPQREFFCADYANIEGRMLAWLAGETWKLDAFRAYDAGTGPDLYKVAYSRSFGVAIDDVTKEQRQVGKVQELALGYQGAVGAFISMGANYGIKPADIAPVVKAAVDARTWDWACKRYDDAENKFDLDCEAWAGLRIVVDGWRDAHPETVQLWADLEFAACNAVRRPGEIFQAAGGKIKYRCVGNFLYCRLPSGRAIAYAYPRVEPETNKLTYWGINSYTRKWEMQRAYGGHLAENVTQGAAACVLRDGLRNVEDAGYPVVMHVHDEIVAERSVGEGSLEEFEKLMGTPGLWAHGLPVAVDGWVGARYRK